MTIPNYSVATNYAAQACYTPVMGTIYADTLFIFNLLADYLLCLAAGRVSGVSLKRKRYFLAALFGAACSVLEYVPGFGFLGAGPCRLALGGMIGLIAYGGEESVLRCTAVFLAVSASFGGALMSARPVMPDLRILAVSFVGCYIFLTLLSGCRAKLRTRRTAEAELCFLGRRCSFRALLDSGNLLTDPISGADVIAVSPQALAPLFAENAALLELEDAVEFLRAADAVPELKGKFRLIPYSAIGGAGLLPVFRPEKLTLDGKTKAATLAAISKNARGGGFDAVAGI